MTECVHENTRHDACSEDRYCHDCKCVVELAGQTVDPIPLELYYRMKASRRRNRFGGDDAVAQFEEIQKLLREDGTIPAADTYAAGVRTVLRQRRQLAKHINDVTFRWPKDFACAQCEPRSEVIVPGFVCPTHLAIAIVGQPPEARVKAEPASRIASTASIRGVEVYVDCQCQGRDTLTNPATGECAHCDGARVTRQRISLEEFARLFTYGELHTSVGRRDPIRIDREIRVREPAPEPETPRSERDEGMLCAIEACIREVERLPGVHLSVMRENDRVIRVDVVSALRGLAKRVETNRCMSCGVGRPCQCGSEAGR